MNYDHFNVISGMSPSINLQKEHSWTALRAFSFKLQGIVPDYVATRPRLTSNLAQIAHFLQTIFLAETYVCSRLLIFMLNSTAWPS